MFAFYASLPAILFEAIGVLGFALYVMNYTLLTMHRVSSHSSAYFIVNTIAASCVLIGLTQSFNLAAALIQGFWIIISIVAIVMRLRPRRAGPAPYQI